MAVGDGCSAVNGGSVPPGERTQTAADGPLDAVGCVVIDEVVVGALIQARVEISEPKIELDKEVIAVCEPVGGRGEQ